ncbi:MAG: lysophospholipid acyltransferase family protein [Proteobacteria bacterium]|nr:lysophospholipid acyltransferase family protein [Pseudomonadota bacterium]
MRLIRSHVFNVAFVVWTALILIGLALLLPLPRRAMLWGVGVWADGVSALARALVGITYEVRGRQNLVPGGAIYASKHQSAWETAVFYRILPEPAYVMKKELFRIPLWGWCARKVGAVSVDRAGGGQALRQLIKACGNAVSLGRQVVIFPEGRRIAPGVTQGYHPGIAAIYGAIGDAPVIPVALNSGLYWGRRSKIKWPGKIVIEFLPALPKGLSRRAFMAELEGRIEPATRRLEAEGAAALAALGYTSALGQPAAAEPAPGSEAGR